MYNKYMPSDAEAFSDLYRTVEYEDNTASAGNFRETESEYVPREKHQRERFDLKRLLHGLDVEKMGIVPLVLLLLLLHDVDDEEKLIIIALVVIFGI